jgi:transcriptional antiterminator NusG
MHTDLNVERLSPPAVSLNWGIGLPWYGVRTRSNHERIAAMVLSGKGYESYLPLYSVRRRGTNGTAAKTELPLFPGYLFCRFDVKKRLPILMTTGVLSVLGSGNEPLAIPEEEIEKVKAILRSGLASQPCANLQEGQRVRVIDGSLAGVEGMLVKKKSQFRMVICISTLERSISVEIDGVRLAAI